MSSLVGKQNKYRCFDVSGVACGDNTKVTYLVARTGTAVMDL